MSTQEEGPAIISIIGRQGSGKTTLIEALVPVFVGRGLRVGTVKDAPHEGPFDRPGSDSARHRAAGAERTLLLGRDERSITYRATAEEGVEREIRRLFAGFDLVLVEGLKRGPFPKIEVWRPGGEPPLAAEIPVLAVVTDAEIPLSLAGARLSPREPESVADVIVSRRRHR